MLFNSDGPPLSVLAATPFTVANHLMSWIPAHPEWDVLRVRGTKSPDDKCFFDELSAALHFPYYFGHNWDAVGDCITDLNWLRGSSFLIVFDSAEYLLSQSERGFRILLRVLADAHGVWHRETADFGVRGRQPMTLQSVFACHPDYVDRLTHRMRAIDAAFTVL
jgi:RNAse (barnase) inhibitor barstar